MGKKPVVVVVGLIWAGMVLVGCENCKNCRKKFEPAPTFGAKAEPVVKQDTMPAPSVVTPPVGAAAKADTGKAVDPVGTQGFEKSAVGIPASAGSTPSPTTQNSLSSPNPDARPVALPGQSTDYRSGETPISKSVPSEGGYRLPPRPPLSQVGGSLPSGVPEPLPPISNQSALPRSPLERSGLSQPPTSAPSLPQPPTSSLPLPSGLPQLPVSTVPSSTSNTMPSLDSIQR